MNDSSWPSVDNYKNLGEFREFSLENSENFKVREKAAIYFYTRISEMVLYR